MPKKLASLTLQPPADVVAAARQFQEGADGPAAEHSTTDPKPAGNENHHKPSDTTGCAAEPQRSSNVEPLAKMKKLSVDIAPELMIGLKVLAARRGQNIKDLVSHALESTFPEIRH